MRGRQLELEQVMPDKAGMAKTNFQGDIFYYQLHIGKGVNGFMEQGRGILPAVISK